MNPARFFYRTYQFWQALSVKPGEAELEQAVSLLSPAQQALFSRLQPSEKAHSLRMFRCLVECGESHPDLLAAALLHDIGKTRFPLRLWQRIWVVLAHRFGPDRINKWSASSLPPDQARPGWRTALLVANCHPHWGAELAEQSGSSALVVDLIRRHQDRLAGTPQNLADHLLQKLQFVDNEN